MNKLARAGVAALALAAASAPINTASALPPPAVAPVDPIVATVGAVYVVGFLLCTGMSFGRQDMLAARAGLVVTGAERFKAFADCLLPSVGLANLAK